MTRAGVASYRAANPGSKLKTAVTWSKLKKDLSCSKDERSYCARSAGTNRQNFLKHAGDP